MTADEWFKLYWCGCGAGRPDVVLRDYFAVFTDRGEGESPRFFLDLDQARAFAGNWTGDVFCLLGYLLGGAGIIEHSGSVVSSAWLTPLGMEVKERALAGDFGEDEGR